MIDHTLRRQGVSGSDIAAIVGVDPRRDSFSVYCDKLDLVERSPPNARMRVGKIFEQAIIQLYREENDLPESQIVWSDQTLIHPSRPWMLGSPDAFVLDADGNEIGLVDAKSVAWDQRHHWGDRDDPTTPDHIVVQLAWYCGLRDLPWGDAAGFVAGNELWVRRYDRDAETEKLLLDAASDFWHNHVLARKPPDPGSSPASTAAIKKMFKSDLLPARDATPEEMELVARLRQTDAAYDLAKANSDAVENMIKLAIGQCEGLLLPDGSRVTWRKNRDSIGPDWQGIATEVGIAANELLSMLLSHLQLSSFDKNYIEEIKKKYFNLAARLATEKRVVTKIGPRVLRRSWK